MKVAIVHDDLMRRGGAEKVLKTICEIYPDAPIYTLAYRPELTYPEFSKKKVITSWYQRLAINEFWMKWLFFPFGLIAMKSIKLEGFDLVIISTTYCAKYVKISKEARIIAYCYTPFRLAWNPESYNVFVNSKGPTKLLFRIIVSALRKIDRRAASRIDHFIAMTQETKERLINAYGADKDLPIINPAVELANYSISNKIGDYYLLVSRFEPYKKVDLVIEAFNQSGRTLIIVGRGSQEEKLKSVAGNNISFLQNLSNEDLSDVYCKCKGFIFPQHEDYGLTPLEANAAGRPVIAYAKGGVLDTVVPYQKDPDNATAFFFYEQTSESLNEALTNFENLNFRPEVARKNAERFSEVRFKAEFVKFVKEVMK